MALFKCKMCGGDLEIAEGVSIAECEYCGTKQTVPKSMDENLQSFFNRANILRIKSEFDKAAALYEKIIQADPTQSEAYWGLILCKYGIEYVDDPATLKKIPTCHRASYDSIISDDDYKSALENADMSQRAIYEEQAKEIDRIQKDILALAQKEETYDVFICYKETDANGQRTQDSVIANDIYYQLTNEGFKVFYAAITLEGKLGSAYEPIIFAALNSAKVMLAIGTKPEYFNAVWVKNEWSRYLKIIKKDRSKLLIPCYRDMDAYELPEEFSHLQAQDMAKIGFINDLVRGIKKVIKKDEPKATTVVKETVVTNNNSNANPLIDRAFLFLEDGNWESADEYAEKALDLDPKNARAYIVKLMVEFEITTQEELKELSDPFDDNVNYQKAFRFADDSLKKTLLGYIETINNNIAEATYIAACDDMSDDVEGVPAEDDLRYCQRALEAFESIRGYKDADRLAEKCRKKIEELQEIIRKDEILSSAKDKMEEDKIASYEEAIKLLSTIGGWEDADALVVESQNKIEKLKIKAAIQAKRNKKIAIIATPIVCVIVAFIIVLNTVIIPNGKYNDAVALMDAGTIDEAYKIFKEIGNYKDANSIAEELKAKILKNAEDLYYAGDARSASKLLSRCGIDDPGYGAVAKGDYKYAAVRGLTNIVIPDSVTSIGDYAFFGCSSLTSINVPDGVTNIGHDAFSGCSSLTSITFPNGVTRIGARAFKDCTGLTSFTIPNSVTEIGPYAFEGCTSLTSITIPNGVTKIDMRTFKWCTSLTSITFPNSVTEIGYSVFEGCTGLTSITIPDSVTKIGYSAFEGCTSLTNITIPNSVTEFDFSAFEDCTSLTSITFKGTIANWRAIHKGTDWNYHVPATEVVCSDGTIKLS